MSKLRGRSHLLRGGLFERLARQSDEGAYIPLHQSEMDALLSSIKKNLNNILNGSDPLGLKFLIVGDVSFESKTHTLEFNLLIDKGRSCKIY